MRRRCWALAALLLALARPASAQGSHLLVVVGLGGDEANQEAFHQWAGTLVDAARTRFKLPEERVVWLGEDPARDPARMNGRSTREEIEAAVERLARDARPGDQVLVVLIGHGDTTGAEPRFNLPGRDLAASDFARLAGRFKAQTLVFVNTASASGGFVEALAGRDRVVITATKTGGERNQTRFGEFFAQSLASEDADLDKDGRVSLLEAFLWSRRRVVESYEKDGQILTEHAVLDDDGNGKGSDTPGQPGADGAVARTVFLAPDPGRVAAEAAADPALRALYDERKAIEDRIGALRAARDTMDQARYDSELERLLIDLARKTREIRDKEKPKQ